MHSGLYHEVIDSIIGVTWDIRNKDNHIRSDNYTYNVSYIATKGMINDNTDTLDVYLYISTEVNLLFMVYKRHWWVYINWILPVTIYFSSHGIVGCLKEVASVCLSAKLTRVCWHKEVSLLLMSVVSKQGFFRGILIIISSLFWGANYQGWGCFTTGWKGSNIQKGVIFGSLEFMIWKQEEFRKC